MPLHFLALLHPKPDKVARVEEIAQSVCEYVHENEPGVLKYQWFRTGYPEKPMIVVLETYLDQAAVDTHKASSKLAWLVEVSQKEDNMTAPIELLPLEEFAGWESRS
ncbi:hypothetical protein N656DRAFT_849286 [Canariomyces notabilis]|uniref:ABM domain-containing protein n=1 Tax=Canariomyces notabilis TaxID=2074819 RepID=A0AAN6QHP4_9PEZI|nr:hypothetical protein N656DRAFT_849286 [Canariomyces arenarius]